MARNHGLRITPLSRSLSRLLTARPVPVERTILETPSRASLDKRVVIDAEHRHRDRLRHIPLLHLDHVGRSPGTFGRGMNKEVRIQVTDSKRLSFPEVLVERLQL